MDYTQIKQALAISPEGNVRIAPGTLTKNIDELLRSSNLGNPLVLTGARYADSAAEGTVAIEGTSDFLNRTSLSALLTASEGAGGDVSLTVRFTLAGSCPGDWTFSGIFPDLPKVLDWSDSEPVVPFDSFALSDSFYLLASHAHTGETPDASYAAGLNFAGQLQPTGIVGVIKSVFGKAQPSTISGPLVVDPQVQTLAEATPVAGAVTLWTAKKVPGFQLTSALGTKTHWGKLVFGPVNFHAYSATDLKWAAKNTAYRTTLGYSGVLEIPSADLKVQLSAPIDIGAEHMMLFGEFKGFTLAKFAGLLDLTGTAELQSMLPDALKAAGETLGRLELMSAAIEIDWSKKTPAVGMVNATVGIPDFNWRVWDDHFVINSISARFDVTDPFGTPDYDITVNGKCTIEGVPVKVRAGSKEGFTIYAELGAAQTIPLRSLMQTYAPGVPPPGDLTVDALRVSIAPFRSYSMAVAMAQQPNPWVLDVGFQKLTVSNLTLAFSYPKGGPVAGFFSGEVGFGDTFSLALRYDIPGQFRIRGEFPEVRLSNLVSTLSNEAVTLPGGFDLTFEQSYALIQYSGANLQFLFGTHLAGFGTFAFEARRRGVQWGFAAGLSIDAGDASTLGGLSVVKTFQEFFALQRLLLIVSSFADTSFQFPGMDVFDAPEIAGGRLSLPATGVIAGVNFFGEWVIDTSKREQKLLRNLLGLNPTLSITLQLGKNPSQEARLYLSWSTVIAGVPLKAMVGGQIQGGKIGVFLEGEMTVSIQSQPQTFAVKLDVVANGAFLAATMRGNTPVKISLEGTELFQIGNLAIAVGVNWEGIPSLGVAGSLEIQGIQSSVAIFFDSTQPTSSLVAGSLSDLSLKTILNTMTGHLAADAVPAELMSVLDMVALSGTKSITVSADIATDLDNLKLDSLSVACAAKGLSIPSVLTEVFFVRSTRGSVWYLTDQTDNMRHYQLRRKGDEIEVSLAAQLYCAPQKTQIGSLPSYDAGFFLTGAIYLFGFRASATVEVNPNRGIAVSGAADKLVVGDEKLFSIKASRGDGGPALSVSTFAQPANPVPELRNPHFLVNGRMTLLGLSRDVYASVTTSGIDFELKGEFLSIGHLNLKGNLGGPSYVGVSGDMRIGVGEIDLGPLGKVNLGTRVNGRLAISVGKDSFAEIEAGFRFADQGFDLPKLRVDVSSSFFAGIVELLATKVKDALLAFLTDAARWAKLVAEKVITGVQDMVKVLEEQFHKTLQEAQEIARTAKELAEKVCSTTRAALAL